MDARDNRFYREKADTAWGGVMDKRQRIGQQRALVREAIGKLRAATELFGVENSAVAGRDGMEDYLRFKAYVDGFEEWVFEASPIA